MLNLKVPGVRAVASLSFGSGREEATAHAGHVTIHTHKRPLHREDYASETLTPRYMPEGTHSQQAHPSWQPDASHAHLENAGHMSANR